MIQTLLVYLSLLFCMVFFVLPGVKLRFTLSSRYFNIHNISIVLASLIFAVIFGLRYGVGVDHIGYMERYISYQSGDMWWAFLHYQPGYRFIAELFANLGFHFWIYFAFWAFLQVFFILWAIRRNQKEILPFLIFSFILGGTAFSYMNLIRQAISVSFFIFSIEFIYKRKLLLYYLLIIIAFYFHQSALILVPIYFIFRFKKSFYFKRIWIQYILLGISLFILYQNYIEVIFKFLINYADFFGYEHYFNKIFSGKMHLLYSLTRSRGIGFYLILIQNIILIAYSNKVKEFFSKGYFSIIYDLYFVGVIYGYISNGSIILSRPNYYFNCLNFIVVAYTLHFTFKNLKLHRNYFFIFIFLILLNVLIFAALMYRMNENSYRFIFFWQDHLFYLKS